MAEKHFTFLPARHGDHHGLWIDPQNPNRIANVNDGGASISIDGGKTWTTQNNQPTAQFYHVAVDNAFPLSHLWRATGQLERWHCQPHRLGRNRARRLVHSRRAANAALFVPDPRDWHIIYSNNEGFIDRYDKTKEEDAGR